MRATHIDRVRFLFGDGIAWAGCTLIALLGQQALYDMSDFAYHIINVVDYEAEMDIADSTSDVTIVVGAHHT